jgi:Uncharacterized ACR, COG1753.
MSKETTKVLLQNHFGVFLKVVFIRKKLFFLDQYQKLIYMYGCIHECMTKNVALSDKVIKELNGLKGDKESYSKVIEKLLANQPKTDNERIYKLFEPLKEGICKIIDQKMHQPIELFRVICNKLTSEKYYKRNEGIDRLVEVLEGYLDERGYLKELKNGSKI